MNKMNFKTKGEELREQAKQVVYAYMKSQPECRPNGSGQKQAVIFRDVGFDWGSYDKATSSNQQYWIVALLNNMAEENLVEQVGDRGPWRLR
jgi:hypothetical protein